MGEKSFLDQFLIIYIIEVEKIPTLCLVNFGRVDHSLQLDALFLSKLKFEILSFNRALNTVDYEALLLIVIFYYFAIMYVSKY